MKNQVSLRFHPLFLKASLSLLAVGAAGCAGPGTCKEDSDCSAAEVCSSGKCEAKPDAGADAGADAGEVVPGGKYCESCASDDDCGGPGNFCLSFSATGSGACGSACNTNTDCPSGAVCQAVMENGKVVGQNCGPVEGVCPALDAGPPPFDAGPPPLSYCDPCESSSQCTPGGFCLQAAANGPMFCGGPCETNADCPSDATCFTIYGDQGVPLGQNCFPTSGVCSTADVDAGLPPPFDAGPRPDAGPGDAGQVEDAGLPADAGLPLDAGVSVDGGPGLFLDAGDSLPTIPLTGCSIVGYLVPVTVGGVQNFELTLDTGSSTTAIAGSSCPSCTDAGVTPEFLADSSTLDGGMVVRATYGDGSGWSGYTVTDQIELDPAAPAVSTVFVDITKQRRFFQPYDCTGNMVSTVPQQGILGMGPPDLLDGMTQDFFNQFVGASMLPNSFSVQLCPEGNGNLWLGGYDPSYMAGRPQFTSIPNGNEYWEVTASMTFEGMELATNSDSIVDTGTSINILPTAVYNAIVSGLKGNTALTQLFGSTAYNDLFGSMGGCDNTVAGQSLRDVNAALPSMQVTFQASDGSGPFTLDVPATGSYLTVIVQGGVNYYCAGIADSGQELMDANQALLGDLFLSSFITVFDIANNRIGFAPEIACQ